MDNKRDYLVVKLTKEENVYLKAVATTTRNKYIRDNYDYMKNNCVNIDDTLAVEEASVLDMVINKCEAEIKSAIEFEKIITYKELYNSVKALSLREKMVLFCLYGKNKSINQTSKEMQIARETVWRIRNKALNKLAKAILGGANKYV